MSDDTLNRVRGSIRRPDIAILRCAIFTAKRFLVKDGPVLGLVVLPGVICPRRYPTPFKSDSLPHHNNKGGSHVIQNCLA